ncbi:hypothetical protein BDF14DRAFT_1731263, partial [Spinellus fusiger]
SFRSIYITTIGVIYEKEAIDLILRRPRDVEKKHASSKKRKRDNSGANEFIEINARIGTQVNHLIQLITGVMGTLDAHKISDRYLILNNTAIHKVAAVQELLESRGYKYVYLFLYSF